MRGDEAVQAYFDCGQISSDDGMRFDDGTALYSNVIRTTEGGLFRNFVLTLCCDVRRLGIINILRLQGIHCRGDAGGGGQGRRGGEGGERR